MLDCDFPVKPFCVVLNRHQRSQVLKKKTLLLCGYGYSTVFENWSVGGNLKQALNPFQVICS